MAKARLQGIDQDGESRSVLLSVPEPASTFLAILCACGWKYARLERDSAVIGEVAFNPALLHRDWQTFSSGGVI